MQFLYKPLCHVVFNFIYFAVWYIEGSHNDTAATG